MNTLVNKCVPTPWTCRHIPPRNTSSATPWSSKQWCRAQNLCGCCPILWISISMHVYYCYTPAEQYGICKSLLRKACKPAHSDCCSSMYADKIFCGTHGWEVGGFLPNMLEMVFSRIQVKMISRSVNFGHHHIKNLLASAGAYTSVLDLGARAWGWSFVLTKKQPACPHLCDWGLFWISG